MLHTKYPEMLFPTRYQCQGVDVVASDSASECKRCHQGHSHPDNMSVLLVTTVTLSRSVTGNNVDTLASDISDTPTIDHLVIRKFVTGPPSHFSISRWSMVGVSLGMKLLHIVGFLK